MVVGRILRKFKDVGPHVVWSNLLYFPYTRFGYNSVRNGYLTMVKELRDRWDVGYRQTKWLFERRYEEIKFNITLLYKRFLEWVWVFCQQAFKSPPFQLVKRNRKRPPCFDHVSKVVIPQKAGLSGKKKNEQAFLYPVGLIFWFFLLWFTLFPTILISGKNLTYSALIIVAYSVILGGGYYLIYHVLNRPVLPGLWPIWPKPYTNLINDFFYSYHIPMASLLPHGIRQRRQVALSIAMRNLFPVFRCFTHWLAPVWLSYFFLVIWFFVSYLFFHLEGVDGCFTLSPKGLLMPIISWWIMSLLFVYHQAKYMKIEYWEFSEKEINKYPYLVQRHLRKLIDNKPEPSMTFSQALNIIQTSAFGVYLVLLIYYETAWSGMINTS